MSTTKYAIRVSLERNMLGISLLKQMTNANVKCSTIADTLIGNNIQ